MAEVLVVSKTHMGSLACVGGLVLASGRYVRLMQPGNWNQPGDTPLEIGSVWDIRFIDRTPLEAPHVEDVVVLEKRLLRSLDDISGFLRSRNTIDWNGPFEALFDGFVQRTQSGSGLIPAGGALPSKSVGFWVSDRTLVKTEYNGKLRYRYSPFPDVRSLSYVGYQAPVDQIPAGTLLRVSLSRLFTPPSNSSAPAGYYLQLSGWYGLEPPGNKTPNRPLSAPDELDDLPF